MALSSLARVTGSRRYDTRAADGEVCAMGARVKLIASCAWEARSPAMREGLYLRAWGADLPNRSAQVARTILTHGPSGGDTL